MDELARTQRRIWRLLTAPDGVRAALAEAGDPEGRSLADWLVSDARAPASLRLEVYANAYFERIRGVLADQFETLARMLGEAGFHDLVTAYLCVHAPERPSLRHVGDRLPDFLLGHAAARPFRRRWPWAPDLARLEWALAFAFDAADSAPLRREQLAQRTPEDWEELVLALRPGVQRLALDWDAAALRQAWEADELPVAPTAPRPATLVVWRRGERVLFRTSDPEEHELLGWLAAGETFGALCDRIAQRHDAASAPERAARWLAAWVDAQLLAQR